MKLFNKFNQLLFKPRLQIFIHILDMVFIDIVNKEISMESSLEE